MNQLLSLVGFIKNKSEKGSTEHIFDVVVIKTPDGFSSYETAAYRIGNLEVNVNTAGWFHPNKEDLVFSRIADMRDERRWHSV